MNESTSPDAANPQNPAIEFDPNAPLAPLPGETAAAYEGFLFYFETPPPRSLRKAAADFGGSEGSFFEWSVKFQWQKRIQAYRVQLAGKQIQAQIAAAEQPAGIGKPSAPHQYSDKALEVSNRVLDRSQALLEQKLLTEGENIPVNTILKMMTVSDQLARPRRNFRGGQSNNNPNSELRKELMAVAEFAREKRLADTAPATPEPPTPPAPPTDTKPTPDKSP